MDNLNLPLVFAWALTWMLVAGAVGYARTHRTGVAVAAAALAGLVCGPVGLIYALFTQHGFGPCRYCRERVRVEALVCPHCRRDEPIDPGVPSAAGARAGGASNAVVALLVVAAAVALLVGVDALRKGGLGRASVGEPLTIIPAEEERTPAAAGPRLKLGRWSWSSSHGYAIVDGTVTNLTSEPLENVMAVASFYDGEGQFITSDEALIAFNPILPGQTSPFKVMATWNPAMGEARIEFQHLLGGTIATE